MGDGIFVAATAVPGFDWEACLIAGTVLDEGEEASSERVMAAAGHIVPVGYHYLLENVGSVAMLPDGEQWLAQYDDVAPDERHLALHDLHLIGVNDRDRPFVTADAIVAAGATFSAAELRDRLGALEEGRDRGRLSAGRPRHRPRARDLRRRHARLIRGSGRAGVRSRGPVRAMGPHRRRVGRAGQAHGGCGGHGRNQTVDPMGSPRATCSPPRWLPRSGMAIIGAHALLYTSEPEAVRAIFPDIFGWDHVDAGDGWLIFALPGRAGCAPGRGPHLRAWRAPPGLADVRRHRGHRGRPPRQGPGRPGRAPRDEGYGITIVIALPGGLDVMLYDRAIPPPSDRGRTARGMTSG